MYIEHAYQQTQQVWPVEYEDQLTLLTSLESAEQYTHEHGGTILDPMPVLSARTVWHCVTLRITDGEHGATYSLVGSDEPERLKPITTKSPSVRYVGSYFYPDLTLEVAAETEERACEIAEKLGAALVEWYGERKSWERTPKALRSFVRAQGLVFRF